MASDVLYEKCLPLLQDPTLEEEDKTEKLEELVRDETNLSGKPLENTVLDILWKHRNAGTPSGSVRHTVVRRNSPAPWQISRSETPTASSPRSSAVSPAPTPTLGVRPPLLRMKSSANSPFNSPRASPRLAYASPQLPYARLATTENSDRLAASETSTEGNPDNFDWLINDDTPSNAYSNYTGEYGFTEPAADWGLQPTAEMSPYDILRHILRGEKTDEEIEGILDSNGYDLSAALASLMESQNAEAAHLVLGADRTVLVGKSMSPGVRPATPPGQAKSGVVCRYWLSTGQCLRADCRFSHDLSNHLCK